MARLQALAGAMFFGVISILCLAGAYAMWPAHFFSTPFASMTVTMLSRSAASTILGIIGLEFLASLAIVTLSDK